MKILPKQTSESGKERSMFLPEDFPVNLSALPEEERERTITAISGHRCYEQFVRYSQLGSLLKTLLESRRWWSPVKRLRWDAQTISSKRITYTERKVDSHSKKSARILKQQDIPSNRLLFQLVPSEHLTEGIESGLLPTVQTQELKQCNKKGKTEFVPLDLLPTPNAMDIAHKDMEINERGRRNPKKGKTDHSLGLEDMAVAKLLPTPCASEATKFTKKFNSKSQMGQSLTALACNGMVPTQSTRKKTIGGTSQLSPLFVEEMMGFPLMWTALPFLSQSGDKNP